MKKIYLKWMLKRYYKRVNNISEEYDCGHNLMLTISTRYHKACTQVNNTLDRLAKIDNTAPKFRFKGLKK